MKQVHYHKIFNIFLVAALLFAVFFGKPAFALEGDALYTVSGVSVDITAASAATARDEALVKARQQAFQILAERLLSSDAMKNIVIPEDAVLGTLIQDFEIQNERVAPTRYIASMTFRFVPEATRNFLGAGNIRDEALSAHSVLILPFLTKDGKNLLWDEGNIWLEAWKRQPPSSSGVFVTVPAGDVIDTESADSEALLSGAQEPLEKLLKRYGAEEAVVAIASGGMAADQPLTVEVYQVVAGELNRTNTLNVVTNGIGDPAAVMDMGVGEVRGYLEKQHEAAAGARASGPAQSEIPVRVVFSSVAQWTEIQKRLDLVPDLKSAVMSLSQSDAGVTLAWKSGDIAALTAALDAQGLLLETPPQDAGGIFSYEIRMKTP